MASLLIMTTKVTALVALLAFVSCTSKLNSDSRVQGKKDRNISDEDTDGLETAQDPVLVTATNLTYDGAGARCSSQLSPGSTELYVISCSAVQITKGSEALAKTVEPGLSIDWQEPIIPNANGVSVESCATSATKLSQACSVRAPSGVNTVGIEFGLKLQKSEGSGTKLNVKKDIVSVPWSVLPIGQVVEVPQINSMKPSDQEQGIISSIIQTVSEFFASFKNLALSPVSKPAIDFPLAGDTQITSCNNKIYLTTRSKIFELDGNKITHIAGSTKFREEEDLSVPTRTYWGELVSIGCANNQLVFSTDSPSAIYRLDPVKWTIEKMLSKNEDSEALWTAVTKGPQTRLEAPKSITSDRLGNIFYLDMDRIRKIDTLGNVSTVFDGTTERTGVYGEASYPALPMATSLALDLNEQGAVRGYFVLVYEPSPESGGALRLVTYLDEATQAIRVVAGRPDDIGIKNNAPATSFLLKSNTDSITSYQAADGKPMLLISSSTQRIEEMVEGESILQIKVLPGEVLQVDATGLAKVLYEAKPNSPVGGGTYDVSIQPAVNQVMFFDNKIHAKLSLTSPLETTQVIVTIPASGTLQLVAGRMPAMTEPYLGSGSTVSSLPTIQSSKLELGHTINTFSNDGTLFIADNQQKRFYRQSPGEQTLKLLATVQSGVLEPTTFSGNILALAARKEPSGSERLVYIESPVGIVIEGLEAPHVVKSLTVSGAAPTLIARSKIPECGLEGHPPCQPNNCDLADSGLPCNPTSVAISPDGLVYFFDSGSRTVRRINAPGHFETVAGAGASSLGVIGRAAGDSQKAGNIGFSSKVSGLGFDRLGNLFVTDSGYPDDCPWGGCVPDALPGSPGSAGNFLPFIAKINLAANSTNDLTQTDVMTILGEGGVASGRINTPALTLNQSIQVIGFTPTAISGLSLLPDGALLFEDAGILMLAKPTENSFSVSRFFGGENEDCGFSTVSGSGTSATLGNALGRICLGKIFGISSFDPCKNNPQGTASIAVSQIISRLASGYDGGGSVLKLDIQCKSLPNNLGGP